MIDLPALALAVVAGILVFLQVRATAARRSVPVTFTAPPGVKVTTR